MKKQSNYSGATVKIRNSYETDAKQVNICYNETVSRVVKNGPQT